MLNVLRESFKSSPYLKWVLAIVAVSMIGFLGSYFTDGGGGDQGSGAEWAARVNGEEIPARQFYNRARFMDQRYQQMFGDQYAQFKAQMKIGQQTINSLIDREIVIQDATRLGLSTSNATLAERIRTLPDFQDPGGQFIGTETYKQIIDRNYAGGTDEFEQEFAQDLLAEQWNNLVTQAITVDDDEVEKLFRERTVKSTFDFVIVPTVAQVIDEEVSEAQLRAFHTEYPQRYRKGEGRRIRYLVVDRDAERKNVEVGAEQIQAYYETNKAEYSHPEQRRARHILLRMDPAAGEQEQQARRGEAEALLARIKGGESIADLALTLSEDPVSASQGGDVGFFGRSQMVQPFEAAVFGTPPGELAPVTKSDFGYHVIQVLETREAGVTPLADVESSIRSVLKLKAAQDAVEATAKRLATELTHADGLAAAAAQGGHEIKSRFVELSANLRDIGASPDFMLAVRELEPGEISQPLSISAGLALVTVDEKVPPAVAPFEDVRDAVRTDLLADRRQVAAMTAGREALAGAKTLAKAAEKLKLEVQSSGDLAPGTQIVGAGGLSAQAEAVLFAESTVAGDSGVVEVPAGALVYEIKSREPYDAGRFTAEKGDIAREVLNQKRGSFRQALLNRLRTQQKIEVNRDLISRFDS